MGLETLPAGFWTFALGVFGILASGAGYVVKRLWDAKAAARQAVEEEADDINERLIASREEAAVCKTKIVYLEARLEDYKEECKELRWKLEHGGGS